MKKILIRGPVLSQSGYGEQTRFALRALRKFPDRFDTYLICTPWGSTGWIWEDNEERRWIDALVQKTIIYQQNGGKFDMSLQVTIPSEWQPQLAPLNIGYTAGIETTKISSKWFEGCFKVNKIIATSNHAKFGIENTQYPMQHNPTGQQFIAHVETPIEVVNYPVRLFEPKEIQLDLSNDFNFLMVAQWGPRKNVEQTIKIFLDEFWEKDIGLVLKIQTVANSRIDREFTESRLKALVDQFKIEKKKDKERKCKLHFLHGDLTNEEMTYIYRHPKIKTLISLTHGEGFGLPLFEAVYNGLPVIAPAWSGQTDFIYMPVKDKKKNKIRESCMIANVSYDIKNIQPEAVWQDMIIPESQWCFPHEWHAKMQMREIHKNYNFHKSRALKLQSHVLEKFETNKMLRMFADAVAEDMGVVNIAEYLGEHIVTNPLLQEVEVFD